MSHTFRRVLVCITDEEWDINNLKNKDGQVTSREEVCKFIHQTGYEPFAIVVRSNIIHERNNDFIEVRLFIQNLKTIIKTIRTSSAKIRPTVSRFTLTTMKTESSRPSMRFSPRLANRFPFVILQLAKQKY